MRSYVLLLGSLFVMVGCGTELGPSTANQKEEAVGSGITVEQTIRVGEKAVIEGPSPSTQFVVVFEDDGQTGYFYGLDTSRQGNPIVDALHIYDVDDVTDKDVPSTVQIVWSADGLKAALLINRYAHAVFDFDAKRGYCRTGFPPPAESWSSEGHDWDDKALELFK